MTLLASQVKKTEADPAVNENGMWHLRSGETVVDRPNSHLHDGVKDLLAETLGMINSERREFIEAEVGFGRVIGKTMCVATGEHDEIVFAQRPKRGGLTRFVNHRDPETCSSMVVILKKSGAVYVLITAFIGCKSEPEPWDERAFSLKSDPIEARARSLAFWKSHALVWDGESVIAGTETFISKQHLEPKAA